MAALQKLLFLSLAFSLSRATFDVNPHQLQMVADHLSLSECRKLSESLHEDAFDRSHTPSGDTEPQDVSCLSLLEHWNSHEGKTQSFHLLATRLRQLDRGELADKLARSVTDEKIGEVQDSFLSDPFKERIGKDSALLEESPHTGLPQPSDDEKVSRSWTTFELLEVVGLAISAIFMLFLAVLLFVKICLPDSFARMRASFYFSFSGRRPGEENVYLIL